MTAKTSVAIVGFIAASLLFVLAPLQHADAWGGYGYGGYGGYGYGGYGCGGYYGCGYGGYGYGCNCLGYGYGYGYGYGFSHCGHIGYYPIATPYY